MVEYHEHLKLGKGAAFVKSKLRDLPQTDDVWEADFQPIPEQVCKRMNQGELWLGLVVSVPERFHLADLLLEVPPPTVNDLARLLAQAMNRPLVDRAHRPARIRLRDNPQWRELLPHLGQLGIEVVTQDSLPAWDEVALDFFRGMREIQVERGISLIALPIDIEKTFPALAHWVQAHGRIEIGVQEGPGVMVRAWDGDRVVFEEGEVEDLSEALVALEQGIAESGSRMGRHEARPM
jgi:uncharacterized protein DUF6930